MAKSKKSEVSRTVEIVYHPGFQDVRDREELEARIEEFERIQEQVAPLLSHMTEMKKAITEYGERKKLTVIQMPDYYWRMIVRNSRQWIGQKTDMPKGAPKGAKSVREICGDRTVKVNGKKKKLWNLVTKRIVDPQAIDTAINKGWITEDEISKAYLEKPGAPFYQKFNGEAAD